MNKYLALKIVVLLVSIAQATVIDVVTDGVGNYGHTGTISDPLVLGETLYFKITLVDFSYSGFPSYDGYWID